MGVLRQLLSSSSLIEKVLASLVAAALLGLSAYLRKILRAWKNRRSLDQDQYTSENTKQQVATQRIYIRPDCQDNDPAHGSPARNRRPLFDEMNHLLGPPPKARLVLLLADSGMGKSSFLLNYYTYHWRNHSRNRHFRMILFPFVQLNLDEFIESVPLPERGGTVLLLDGLDEDPAAINGFAARFKKLMDFASQFRCSVITCRSQFLPEAMTGADIAGDVGLRSLGGVIGFSEGPDRSVRRLYVSPLSDAQVKQYVQARFPWWRFPRFRPRATRAARRFSELVARPLLLTYIRDLADEQRTPKNAFQVYEIIVNNWLEREVTKKQMASTTANLLTFSGKLAAEMFQRGRDRIAATELDTMANSCGVTLDAREVKERSLLHHDGEHNWKFAHRSIMEYLLVRQLCGAVMPPFWVWNSWTDQMRQFASDVLRSDEPKSLPGADLSETNLRSANLSRISLQEATLIKANLIAADLSRANLSATNLMGADLREAKLAYADLTDARMDGAELTGVDLRRVKIALHQAVMAKSNTATAWPVQTSYAYIGSISRCVLSPRGDFIVAVSPRALMVWYSAATQKHLFIPAYGGTVGACAVSPKGDFIVSALTHGSLTAWDSVTGNERFTVSVPAPVSACAVSPKDDLIVFACNDEVLKVYNPATGKETLRLLGHEDLISACAVSPQGNFIVSASNDTTLRVWDLTRGKERFILSGHDGVVTACAISPQADFIVSASHDKTLRVWDSTTGKQRFILSGHDGVVTACAVSPQADFIVSASYDKTLRVWDLTTGKELLILSGHNECVSTCDVSPQGDFIVSGSHDQTLKLWFPRNHGWTDEE